MTTTIALIAIVVITGGFAGLLALFAAAWLGPDEWFRP